MERLRVATISDWYLPRFGGIELYLGELTARLDASGTDVEVLTPIPGPAEVNGVTVHRLCDAESKNGGYAFPPCPSADNVGDFLYILDLFFRPRQQSALRQLGERLAAGSFDVAHVHLGNTPFAYLAINICRAVGLPVVATFHSLLGAAEPPFAMAASRLLGCRDWPKEVYLTAVSSRVAETRAVMFGRAPFQILPNGLDTGWWAAAPAQHGSRRQSGEGGRIRLAAAMRLHPRKRPLTLIKAIKHLASRHQGVPPVHLRIAGDGPLRTALQQRIGQLGLADSVELVGNLPKEGVARLFAESDLFLMPSYLESFGIAALEARAAGLPVLAMRKSGARDFLTHDQDSLLVDSDAAFAEALVRFVEDEALRTRLRQGCQKPLSGYSWPDVLEQCRSAYQAAIAMRSRGS